MVLADLVVGVAETRLRHRHVGKRAVALGLHQRPCRGLAGAVEQGLRSHGLIGRLRVAGTGNEVVYFGGVVRHGASFRGSAFLNGFGR